MNAHSEDLRKKIVETKERGVSTKDVARALGVGLSSVKRYVKTAREARYDRRGTRADAQRLTSVRGGSWKRTSKGDPPPPSPRRASTCRAWPG
jgi:transposase